MKNKLIRWQNIFHPRWHITYDYNIQIYNNRPYRPYANKKSFYMQVISNLKIGQRIIVKKLCNFTLKTDWIGHIEFHTGLSIKQNN